MIVIRKIRNASIAVSIIFICGILGSLELDTITLSQTIDYITMSGIFCAFVMALEVMIRFFRALLVVYARRKRAAKKASFAHRTPSTAKAQLA